MTVAATPDGPNGPPESPADGSWDAPPRGPPNATSPVLSVDGFEGPLDWLLEMVRARKIDLARLSILALVEAFASAMDAALSRILPTPELARWASWTVMAAQLTELRSRLLLPTDVPDGQAARAEAESLRQHWLTRAEMAEAADWLDRQLQLGRDVFGRGQPEPAWTGQGIVAGQATTGRPTAAGDDTDDVTPGEGDDLTALLRACLVALRLPVNTEVYQPRQLPFWSVGDATNRINQLLPGLPGGAALEMFLPDVADRGPRWAPHRRAAIAATLVAGLELARSSAITLKQAENWKLILVT
ncbi:MAG: segregation and condensation protein A [Janthinobacterium lividum]